MVGQCFNRLHFKVASRSPIKSKIRVGTQIRGGGRLKHCCNVSQKWLERCKPDLVEFDSELPSVKLSAAVSEGEVERNSEEEESEGEIEEDGELEESDGLCEEEGEGRSKGCGYKPLIWRNISMTTRGRSFIHHCCAMMI